MAAGATGATTGKAAPGGAQRGNGSTIAQLVGHDHETATPVAGASPNAKPRSGADAVADSNDTMQGTRAARPATRTAGAVGGQGRSPAIPQAAASAPFAQALAQMRSAPAAGATLAELAQVSLAPAGEPAGEAPQGSEPLAKQEDSPDGASAGDAASAALAAVLQWLRPVTATNPGDPQAGNGGHGGTGAGAEQSALQAAAAVTAPGAAAGAMAATASAVVPGAIPAALGAASRPANLATNATAAESVQGDSRDRQASAAAQPGGALALPGGTVAAAGAQALATPGFETLASALRSAAAFAEPSRGGELPDGQADAVPAAAAGGAGAGTQAATQGLDVAAAWRTGAGTAAAVAERTVPVNMHDRHWPQAVAGQVLVLANQRIDTATLRLSPEHLGPVEVRIDLQGQGVNVNFGAEHADTRAALEQAMPQLRAAFAGAGLTLGQATVQQHMRRESQNAQAVPNASAAPADQLEVSPAVLRAIGLLDEYA